MKTHTIMSPLRVELCETNIESPKSPPPVRESSKKRIKCEHPIVIPLTPIKYKCRKMKKENNVVKPKQQCTGYCKFKIYFCER